MRWARERSTAIGPSPLPEKKSNNAGFRHVDQRASPRSMWWHGCIRRPPCGGRGCGALPARAAGRATCAPGPGGVRQRQRRRQRRLLLLLVVVVGLAPSFIFSPSWLVLLPRTDSHFSPRYQYWVLVERLKTRFNRYSHIWSIACNHHHLNLTPPGVEWQPSISASSSFCSRAPGGGKRG